MALRDVTPEDAPLTNAVFSAPPRLTAFVMKSFGGARPYIFVDLNHITEARKWLAKHQRPDGCIRSVGKLFHNGMKVTAPPPEASPRPPRGR